MARRNKDSFWEDGLDAKWPFILLLVIAILIVGRSELESRRAHELELAKANCSEENK